MDVDDGRTTAMVGIPSLPPTGTFTIPTHMTTTTIVPQKRKQKQVTEDSSTTETIDCICGFAYEDGGLSIACDDCGRWCHTTCFNIIEGAVPEEWRCWECLPRPVDKERAVFLQQQRQRQSYETMRRLSPGVEKKPRRTSAPAIEGSGGRRKRSILTQQPNNHPQPTRIEEEPIDVCEPPSTSYVHISRDVVPNREARQRLERASRGWRGITALDLPEVELHPPRTVLQPLPPSLISQSPHLICSNPHVRPPSFSLHTAQPIPRSAMITPYPSTILPSSTYLSDPLNAYAHLGMPKPFVHLIGPPLDLALDSRITGSEARFARSGCRPNAVLRPMICNRSKDRKESMGSVEESGISFGVFALRDMKADEEVVLGWEWDDGHAVHHLPTLIESPGLYSPHHLEHLRTQMSCMLHTLSSTFTTCACGLKSKECALRLMEAFVDYELPPKPPNMHVDLGPLVGHRRGFRTREKVPFSGGLTGVEMVTLEPMSRATSSSSTDSEPHGRLLDGDIKSQQAVPSTPKPSSVPPTSRKRRHDGTIRSRKDSSSSDSEVDHSVTPRQKQKRRINPEESNSDLPRIISQRTVPAKMRKQWIHQTIQEATPRPTHAEETSGTEEEHMDIDHDSAIMPPPPVPPRRKSKKTRKASASASPASVSSPSTHFAKLSLLSPTVEISKMPLDATSSFNNRPVSPTPLSPTPAAPIIKLHTTPISPLPAFTSLPTHPAVTKSSLVLDMPAFQQHRPLADDISPRSASPNLLCLLPGLSRGLKEEPIPTPMQELSTPLPMDMEFPHMTADGDSLTCAPPNIPSESVPPVNDLRPSADSLSPREPPTQRLSDHLEPMSTPELLSSPPTTQNILQLSPQDTPAAEFLTEVKQEPERQSTPPPAVREASPAPQKVKTSFKDFLMRKKKEQVESPVISPSTILVPEPVPTIPAAPAGGSDGIANSWEEANETAKKQGGPPLEQPSEPPVTEPSDVDMDTSNSPVPESDLVKVKSEIVQPLQVKPDDPPESWLLDSQLLRPGIVADLRQDSAQDWVHGEFVGVHGVIESVVNLPGRPPTALFKPIDGKAHAIAIPVTAMIPVRPSEEGEVVIILSGKHKGKIGEVVRLAKDMVSVDLDGPETVLVDVEPSWLCLFSREGRAPLPNQLPVPPRVSPEKGSSMSPSPAPQSEDGEIPQDPPPRSQSQQLGNSSFPRATTPLRAAPLNAPTQPRSFQNSWKNNISPTTPSRSNSLSHLINANLNGSVNNNLNNLGNAFANSPNRPSPPSGPKALRGLNPRAPFDVSRYKPGGIGSGLSGNVMSGLPGVNGSGMGAGLKRELNPNNGHPAIPKGPSADRERERERANGGWSTKNWGNGWR